MEDVPLLSGDPVSEFYIEFSLNFDIMYELFTTSGLDEYYYL